jgi:hypothetical protein
MDYKNNDYVGGDLSESYLECRVASMHIITYYTAICRLI